MDFWIVLGVALLASSLGLKGLIGLVLAAIAFIIGSLVMILGLSFSRQNLPLTDYLHGKSRQSWNWFKGPMVSNEKVMKNEADATDKIMMWEQTSLTGKKSLKSHKMFKTRLERLYISNRAEKILKINQASM